MNSLLKKIGIKPLDLLFLILVAVIAAISARSLLGPGLPSTHDGIWHIERMNVMADELSRGQFPVRWAEDLDVSYGLPLFNYVYPGPYYLSASLVLLGLGNIAALKLTTLGFYMLGGLGMYLIFRKKPLLGMTASIVYLFSPYQFVNIFLRFAYGEIVVMGILPFIFLSLEDLKNKKSLKWHHPIPLFLAIISHNFLGMITFGLAFLYIFTFKQKRLVLKSLILSLSLSAFFLLPMILESKYLYAAHFANFSYSYTDHFIYPAQLFNNSWDYGFSAPGVEKDGINFFLGYPALLALIYSLYLLAKKKRTPKLTFWFILSILTIFITLPVSKFIWNTFSFIQVMQFPWRFLAIIAFTTTLALGYSLKKLKKLSLIIYLIIILFAIIPTLSYHKPERTLSDQEFHIAHKEQVGRYATSKRTEIVPKWSTEEKWNPVNEYLVGERLAKLEGGFQALELHEGKSEIYARLRAENNETTAVIYRNYFPSWKATVDGEPLSLSPTEDGNIEFSLLQGDHEYHIYVGSTTIEKLANIITLLSVLYLVKLGLTGEKKNK